VSLNAKVFLRNAAPVYEKGQNSERRLSPKQTEQLSARHYSQDGSAKDGSAFPNCCFGV
jgi:hypothetical protein